MIDSKPGIMIATPCYGAQLSEGYFHGVLSTIAAANKYKFKIHVNTVGNESLVTRARNTLVAQFLDMEQQQPEKFSHLMFIDADLGFKGETVHRLVNSGFDVVCGVYPQKSIDWKQIKILAEKGDYQHLQQKALNYNLNFSNSSKTNINNGFAEVEDGATGFMCIKKEVFFKMKEAYPLLKYTSDQVINGKKQVSNNTYAFFDSMIDQKNNRYLSEDYAFCRLWQKLGGKVYADLRSPLTHYGSHAYHGNFWSKLNND